MGGGGLQILKHKSWNVYGGANIEKVRRDEEAAREREKKEEGRRRIADSEQRLEKLRSRNKDKRGKEEEKDEHSGWLKEKSSHILGDLPYKEEDDEDKPAPGQKPAKVGDLIGFAEEPWYSEGPLPFEERFDKKARGLGLQDFKKNPRKRHYESTVNHDDPMTVFAKPPTKSERKEETSSKSFKKRKTVEEMRQERMMREKAERDRALAVTNPRVMLSKKEELAMERKLPYSSAFNPEFVRTKRGRH
ncbi:hypothetical protein BC829DRAFT_386169 [Chytridium lagenaria]|nr:hypothetical protein BC829DRAFT_386169 [Chytridium lagenaria]